MASSVYDTIQQYRTTTVGPRVSHTGWSPIAWSTQHAPLAVPSSSQSMNLHEDTQFVYSDWSVDQNNVVFLWPKESFSLGLCRALSQWRLAGGKSRDRRSLVLKDRAGKYVETRNSTERSVARRQQSLQEVSDSLCNPNGYNGARNCPPLDISHMTSHTRSTL